MNRQANETAPWTTNLSMIRIANGTLKLAVPVSVTDWTCVNLLVCAFGCCTNILALLVTWPRHGDKSGVNLLIFHFVMVNLLNCLVHYPIRSIMVQARQAGYVASLAVCYPIQALNGLNWLVVFWADNSLAINRCVALFFPHHYKWYSSTRNNVLQIVAIWILCTSVALNYELTESPIVVLPIGHCATRGTATGSLSSVLFVTCKNVALGLGGLASLLVLGKCCVLSRKKRSVLAAAGTGGVGQHDLQNAVKLRSRVRLALGLVVTYVFSAVTSSSSFIIIVVFPAVFTNLPLANLWLQTVAMAQYIFPACIIFFSNQRYLTRLRQLLGPLMRNFAGGKRSMKGHGAVMYSADTLKTTGALNSDAKIHPEIVLATGRTH